MEEILDTLRLYTKLLTALVIILNIALILCLRSHIAWVKEMAGTDTVKGGEFFKSKLLYTLVVAVMLINGAAVVANQRLQKAIKDVSAVIVQSAK